MKCGHCKNDHATLQEVRDCATLGVPTSKEVFAEAQRQVQGSVKTITDRQLGYLKHLCEERPAWAHDHKLNVDQLHTLTSTEGSFYISEALKVPREQQAQQQRRLPFANVPEGYYAVVSATGNNDLDFFRVKRKVYGDRELVFVDRVVGGHPDYSLRENEARAAVQRIFDAGHDEAGMLYAKEIGRCRKCNRHLTDEASRQAGLGPVCRAA